MILLALNNYASVFVIIFWGFVNLSLAYTVLNIENEKVCPTFPKPFSKKRELKLDRDNYSSIIVKEDRYFNYWSGSYEFKCKFKVKSGKTDGDTDGVIAVIQYLSLRKDENTENCIDYVQFKSSKKYSPKYCGKMKNFKPFLTADGSGVDRFTDVASNAFIDPKGEMEVEIFVGSKETKPDDQIDIELVFTSYVECSKKLVNYSECGSQGLCISSRLFNDGIVNCPFTNCVDEGGCIKISDGDISTTPILVSTLTGFLLSFIFFFICICILRYKRKLCWSTGLNQPRTNYAETVTCEHIPSQGGEEELQTNRNPSAPIEESGVSQEKDLPPSYESLFPQR